VTELIVREIEVVIDGLNAEAATVAHRGALLDRKREIDRCRKLLGELRRRARSPGRGRPGTTSGTASAT
jgi:hypothetical protein